MTTAAIWHTNKLAVSMEGFTEYGKDRSGESRLIWDKLHEAPFNTLSRCPINVQIIQTRGKLNRFFCSRYPAVLQASLCNKTMTDGPIFHFRPSFFRVHYLSGYQVLWLRYKSIHWLSGAALDTLRYDPRNLADNCVFKKLANPF